MELKTRKSTVISIPSLFQERRTLSSSLIRKDASTNTIQFLHQKLPEQATANLINRLSQNKLAPLHYAAKDNNVEIIVSLITHGADVNIAGTGKVTPLHIAAKYNKLAAVQTLITYNANIQANDVDNNTSLHYAAKAGHLDICKELIVSQPFMIDDMNKKEMTALHLACIHNRNCICTYLIEQDADITAKTGDGSIPIQLAASKGNVELMKILLEAGIKRNVSRNDHLNKSNYDGISVLHRAVQCGQEKAVIFCLDAGADISIRDKRGFTPLHMAAITGNDSICQILIRHRPVIDARDDYNRTPLHHAASLNRLGVVKNLLNGGASINITDSKQTIPLLYAVANNHIESAQALIRHNSKINVTDDLDRNCYHFAIEGSDDDISLLEYLLSIDKSPPITSPDKYGQTPMHYACYKGNTKALNLLLKHKPDLNIVDEDGNNCLHIACKYGFLEVIKTLIQHNSDLLSSEGEHSCNCLHIAIINNRSDVIEFLLEHGAEINRRDGKYRSPLDIACTNGNIQSVKTLIKYGVSINSVNRLEETALHIAARHGRATIVQLLLSKGANALFEDCNNKNCLEVAIQYHQQDVAIEIATSHYSREILNKVGADKITTMQAIIQWSPEVSTVEYDFTILDPGIEFETIHEAPNGIGSFNCLKTIASSNHIELFNHPLPAKLLKTKWSKFGNRIYGGNLAIYIAFIIALSTYAIQIALYKQSQFPEIKFVGFNPPTNVSTPIPTTVPFPSFIPTHGDHDNDGTVDIELREQQTALLALQLLIAIFSGLNIIRELFQMYQERLNYLLSIENYMELALHVTVFVFINFATANDEIWCAGSLAILLSFIDLIMFLRKLPYVGKYVLMLRSMASTALKVSFIASVMMAGFAVSFSMLCNRQVAFYSFALSLVKTVDMTIGEIDYDSFLTGIKTGNISYPNSYMVLFQLIIFILVMPILMMNLMIGLAVGDIAAMEKKASLERLVDLTEFFHRTEKALPAYLRRYCVLDKIVCIEKKKKDKQIRKNKDELMQGHLDAIHDMEAINRRLKVQRLKLDALEEKINLIRQCSEKVLPPLSKNG